jgi:hypothetical protein
MPTFPHLRRKVRAPRVNLWGTASATIRLENGKELWAKALRISITGGLLELTMYLDEGVPVNMTLHLGTRTVRGKAATLFPMLAEQGYLQPFRFTDLREEDSLALETQIQELMKQSSVSVPVQRGLALRPRKVFQAP